MKHALGFLLAVWPACLLAGNADDICVLASPERHGFRCQVAHYDDGSAPVLMLKSYVVSTDSKERKARYRLASRQLVEAHYRDGGIIAKIRFRAKDGAWYERSCNRGAGTYTPYCNDAERVRGE